MIDSLKTAYRALLAVDNETPRVTKFVLKVTSGQVSPLVVDIGCGYGRTLRALQKAGIHAIGIDVNPVVVASNNQEGLRCFTPDEFTARTLLADVLIMSHVIEHFAPSDLLAFLDTYLASLREDGYLLIATPLLSPRFYDDFDHVKPYQPMGIGMIFGGQKAQVQYYGKTVLILQDIWFRRSPYSIAYARGMYIKSWATPACQFFNLSAALAFHLSAGLIGSTTGWVGLFRKSK